MSFDWKACSDGELAGLALAGNEAAFAEIMHRHREPIYRLVRGYVRDGEEALDLTQDAFASAFESLSRYDRVRPLRAWLSRIAINKCRDWNRRAGVRRLWSVFSPSAEVERVADKAPDTDTVVADRLDLARVDAAIATLFGAPARNAPAPHDRRPIAGGFGRRLGGQRKDDRDAAVSRAGEAVGNPRRRMRDFTGWRVIKGKSRA